MIPSLGLLKDKQVAVALAAVPLLQSGPPCFARWIAEELHQVPHIQIHPDCNVVEMNVRPSLSTGLNGVLGFHQDPTTRANNSTGFRHALFVELPDV